MIYGLLDFLLIPFYILTGIFNVKKENTATDKPLIILLHGFMSRNLSLWLLKRRLEYAGYEVLTPESGWYIEDIEKTTNKLSKLVESKDLKKFTIVGFSLGGIVGADYHKKNPRRVASFLQTCF